MIHPLAALLQYHEIYSGPVQGPGDATRRPDTHRILQAVSPALHQRYLKIHRRYGANAIVPRNRGICSGCHVHQPAASQEVERGVFQCQNCHRLLYDPDEAFELSVG